MARSNQARARNASQLLLCRQALLSILIDFLILFKRSLAHLYPHLLTLDNLGKGIFIAHTQICMSSLSIPETFAFLAFSLSSFLGCFVQSLN